MNIHDMQLNEVIWLHLNNTEVLRVPGGWVYRAYDSITQKECLSQCFVPFDNEFKKTSEQGESPATAGNSDYTAALREELMQFLEDESPVLFEDVDFSKLATRLNAALQKRHCA